MIEINRPFRPLYLAVFLCIEMTDFYDILACPAEDFFSGIKTRLYFAPASRLWRYDLPVGAASYESYVIVDANAIFFRGGYWSMADILVDENDLQQNIAGNLQRKKSKTVLNFYLLGFRAAVLGFIEANKNIPMVFGMEDQNGMVWLMGNLRNRAFMEAADAGTGKKYEDNSGAAVKISCNAPLYGYAGSAAMIRRMKFFDKYFDKTFE